MSVIMHLIFLLISWQIRRNKESPLIWHKQKHLNIWMSCNVLSDSIGVIRVKLPNFSSIWQVTFSEKIWQNLPPLVAQMYAYILNDMSVSLMLTTSCLCLCVFCCYQYYIGRAFFRVRLGFLISPHRHFFLCEDHLSKLWSCCRVSWKIFCESTGWIDCCNTILYHRCYIEHDGIQWKSTMSFTG